MFKKLLDNTIPGSLANKFRLKRFRHFFKLTENLPEPVKILDVGGTENFWQQMESALSNNGVNLFSKIELTILNTDIPEVNARENITFVKRDAADLSIYDDNSFDAVFSNSVIEHIPERALRKKMADEIKRVGKKYFVQTPSYYFPFDPHFLLPFFQYLPVWVKVYLLKNFNLGWFKRCKTNEEALNLLKYNQLLKLNEFKNYFPNEKIIKERVLFLTKSFTAMKM